MSRIIPGCQSYFVHIGYFSVVYFWSDVLGSSMDISGCQGYSQDVRVTLYTLVTFPWYTFGVMSWDHPWTSADV